MKRPFSGSEARMRNLLSARLWAMHGSVVSYEIAVEYIVNLQQILPHFKVSMYFLMAKIA